MQTFLGQSGPRTLMTIKMAENSGRDIRDFSLFPGENEILFPPNLCFEVVDSFDAGNQLIMVQCRQTETVDVILDLNGKRTGSGGVTGISWPMGQHPVAQPVDVILDLNGKRTGSGGVTGQATASKPTPRPPQAMPMAQPMHGQQYPQYQYPQYQQPQYQQAPIYVQQQQPQVVHQQAKSGGGEAAAAAAVALLCCTVS
jgi:hypothetical protein